MKKEDCEYCADEEDCVSTEHNMDCIFCECQNKYDTNFTCERCKHDMARCACTEEQKEEDIRQLFAKLGFNSDTGKMFYEEC